MWSNAKFLGKMGDRLVWDITGIFRDKQEPRQPSSEMELCLNDNLEVCLRGPDRPPQPEMASQHEVCQPETPPPCEPEEAIPHSEIFTSPKPLRVVLTTGIAGVGKTSYVHKFTLDWAKKRANRQIDILIPISFRELNTIRTKPCSLIGLIHQFHPALKNVSSEQLSTCLTVFIFDGLDESKFPLNFEDAEVIHDVAKLSSVGVILSNLIEGNLLPLAQLWITSRPAAAKQIPRRYIDRLTEVRGFTDTQKEEYFRKNFNAKVADRIVAHIATSPQLRSMCHIPVFCWITATVLGNMLRADENIQLPTTLAKMWRHFMVAQKKKSVLPYEEVVEKLVD